MSTKASTIQLKISGPGIQFEHEISGQQTSAIVSFVLGSTGQLLQSNPPRPGINPSPAPSPASAGSQLSLREFLNEHEPKRIPEFIAAIASYLKSHRNVNTFTKKNLTDAFEEAQETQPANLGRDITWTGKNGWIAPKSGQKDTYYITSTGESAVNSKFPAEIRRKTKVNLGSRRTKKPKKA